MTNDEKRLRTFAVGDLGPARRHLLRLLTGELQPTPGVLREVQASIERCVDRLEAWLTSEK